MALRLNGSSSGYVELDVPAAAGSHTLTLPDGGGTSGQVLSTDVSGALSFVDRMTAAGPAFSAYASSATSTANATYTKIVCDSEEFDTASYYDTGASRFTPNVAGYYLLTGAVYFGTATQLIAIFKNGTELKRGVQSGTTSTAIAVTTVSALVYLNGSTDYVELYWYHNNGSTVNTVTGQANTYFQGFLARPA
jgi:hypothetical protein